MDEFDQLFARLAAYAEFLAKQREQRNEQRRLASNARNRRRYAARKTAGTLPPRRTAVEPEPEYDAPTSCYCHTAVMPPCSWCESGGSLDDEEDAP